MHTPWGKALRFVCMRIGVLIGAFNPMVCPIPALFCFVGLLGAFRRGTSTSDCLLPGIIDHIDHVGRMAARSPQSPMDYAYADGRPDLTESPPIIV